MNDREKEIRKVAGDLDTLLAELAEAVGGLTLILTAPPAPGDSSQPRAEEAGTP